MLSAQSVEENKGIFFKQKQKQEIQGFNEWAKKRETADGQQLHAWLNTHSLDGSSRKWFFFFSHSSIIFLLILLHLGLFCCFSLTPLYYFLSRIGVLLHFQFFTRVIRGSGIDLVVL